MVAREKRPSDIARVPKFEYDNIEDADAANAANEAFDQADMQAVQNLVAALDLPAEPEQPRRRMHYYEFTNEGEVFFSFNGDELACPVPVFDDNWLEGERYDHIPRKERYEYLHHALSVIKKKENLNEWYRPRTLEDKYEVQDFFHLGDPFIESFTDNWGIVTVFQFNKTLEKFFLLVIIHNGRFSELELFEHLSDPPDFDNVNFVIFQLTNYDSMADVPLGRFNVAWNDFTLALQHERRDEYMQIVDFPVFKIHARIQGMLLDFYLEGDLFQPFVGWENRPVAQPWFDLDKHDWVNNLISACGGSTDCLVETHEMTMTLIGGFKPVEKILKSKILEFHPGGRYNPIPE